MGSKLAQLIRQRTEGNPLFMVNLVDYLITQGVLARIDGQWRLQGEVTAVASWAPESLQQMIEKQIERLSPQDQRVLEVASVAGAEFSAAAVAAGTGIAVEAVEEHCGELARHEQFLRARGTAEWPDGTVAARYGFLHALYQDVLYGRLTARQQQRLHQQIGERVEQAYGERAREIATELAVHFERGRDYRRAVQYLQQAGENAIRRFANQEALSLLTKGLELLQTLPEKPEHLQQELTLQMTLCTPLAMTKGYAAPELEKVIMRARELCQRLEDPTHLFWVLMKLSSVHFVRGELQTMYKLGEQSLSLAQRVQDPAFFSVAHAALGGNLYFLGELASARAHLEQGITFYDSQKLSPFSVEMDPGVVCFSYVAVVLWLLGYPDQALQRSHEALTLAQELSYPHVLVFALGNAAFLHRFRREGLIARKRMEEAGALATEHGFSYWLAAGAVVQGWALAEQGQGEEGIAQMRQGVAAWRAVGARVNQPYFFGLLAETHEKGGQVEKGLCALTDALTAMDRTGEHWYEAELYRLKGTLTLQSKVQSPKSKVEEEAERYFLKAIEIAQKQQAKSLELRATMSVARLWQQQGKKDEARQMLAEIYNWFTEGFDTKDLQEAKALLEALSH